LREVEFRWKRERPEDFIVKEVSDFPRDENGPHYLYLLAKKNLTTKEVCSPLGLSYAGMKDKLAITFQKVSSPKFLGDFLKEERKGGWFALKFLYKVRKKVKVGQLKGNRFAVNLKGLKVREREWFINYYDVQRILGLEGNYRRGRELLLQMVASKKVKRRLSWTQNFLIDSYLSYLWNESFALYLKERFGGYLVREREATFFVPEAPSDEIKELPKFWPLLGYKKKLSVAEGYYGQLLEKEGFSLEGFLNLLKKLGIKGDYRKTYLLMEPPKKVGDYLFFTLPKGAFATMYLKHCISS